ncbi:MAG: hypothetical protein ACHP84_20405 [Caulobacterales bacterium]
MSDLPSPLSPSERAELPARQTPSPIVPIDIRALLGPAPITTFESEDAYERVLAQLALAVSPGDFVEWIWVKDIVDLEWDAARARRAKGVRLALARRAAIENILRADWPGTPVTLIVEDDAISSKADDIYRGGKAEFKYLGQVLERLGLTQASVADAAYHVALDDMERLQQLVDNANARRDAVLREIDRRRQSFSKRARPAIENIDQVIDAEFA